MAPTTPKSHLLLLCLFITSTFIRLSSSATPNKKSVYELLPEYGLPSGLLPDSVTNYTFSKDDGRFVVVLEKPCYVQFDYLVYYDKTVTGKLSYGSITQLKGIQVQRFFLWLNVDEIRVDLPPADNIYFQVGFINKKLSVDQFKTVHSCRDGLTSSPCHGKITLPSLSSSISKELKATMQLQSIYAPWAMQGTQTVPDRSFILSTLYLDGMTLKVGPNPLILQPD